MRGTCLQEAPAEPGESFAHPREDLRATQRELARTFGGGALSGAVKTAFVPSRWRDTTLRLPDEVAGNPSS